MPISKKEKKLTVKQVRKGYTVALAALKSVATNVTPSMCPAYAAEVVKNLENGRFLK